MRHLAPSLIVSVVFAVSACEPKPADPGTTPPTGSATGTPTGTGSGTGTGTGTTTGTTTGSTVVLTPNQPFADDDTAFLGEGQMVEITPLDNDVDPDGDIDTRSLTVVDAPVYGTAQASPSGVVRYTHDGSETVSDVFTYTITDQAGHVSNLATVDVVISPVNDPPIAVDDTGAVVVEGQQVVVNVVTNDTDVDGTVDPSTVTIVSTQGGTASAGVTGTVTFVHDGSDTGVASFSYTVEDNQGAVSNTARVTITVTDVNDVPVAVDDNLFAPVGRAFDLAVTRNDIDPDDGLDLASIMLLTLPVNGTASPNVDGTVTYTHDGGPSIDDMFTYTVQDMSGAVSNVATVFLTIVDNVVVGSFRVNDGPQWGNNPPTYTCREACALLFGGAESDYQCSISNAMIDNRAYSSTWGVGGCGIIAEDYKRNTNYDCGAANCSTSAYVTDNCTAAPNTNYCWL